MILIAYSNATHTDWVLLDGKEIIAHAETDGLNPVFHARREISHIVRLQLPSAFFKKHWDKVVFYGAGCFSDDLKKVVETSLVAQFKSRTVIESDLLGVARGLLGHKSGIAAILSTGSNSCYYNGSEIEKSVTPGGYVLGDEGSAACIGKKIVADVIKLLAPPGVVSAFYATFTKTPEEIIRGIYSSHKPNEELAQYARFVAENLNNGYCHQLAYDSFKAFFQRNISHFDYHRMPLHILGHNAIAFEKALREAAEDFGATIASIESTCLPGLISYHSVASHK